MNIPPRGYEKFDLLSGPQQQIYETLQNSLMGQLGGEGADRFAAPFMRQFQEQTIPKLAERFAGLGAGAQSSSAFQQALGTSAADLSERLASLSGQREQGALSGLQGLLGTPTQGLVKKSPAWWMQLLQPLLGGIGQGLGGLATGGAGSLAGILGGLLGGGGMKQGTFSSLAPEQYGQTFTPR